MWGYIFAYAQGVVSQKNSLNQPDGARFLKFSETIAAKVGLDGAGCLGYRMPSSGKGGRVVECTGLENRQGFIALRGFESLPFRQLLA